jgi:hypothetical protein
MKGNRTRRCEKTIIIIIIIMPSCHHDTHAVDCRMQVLKAQSASGTKTSSKTVDHWQKRKKIERLAEEKEKIAPPKEKIRQTDRQTDELMSSNAT